MSLTVVITGASSGIGEALALRYARDGARLGLLGRNRERLDAVAGKCRALGAEVDAVSIDVTEHGQLAAWLDKFDKTKPVDIVIANAGVLSGLLDGQPIESAEMSRELIETNVIGVLNTVHPLLPPMLARRRGSIALMSSIAGFIPLPQMPGYSASKAAVLNYGLSLRAALRPHGIGVSVICPGYIDTPMTGQVSGPTPFRMSAEKAADCIYRGIARNRAIIAFPWFFALVTRIVGFLPDWARRYLSPPLEISVSPRK